MSEEVQEELGDLLSAFGIPELAKHIVPIPTQPSDEEGADGDGKEKEEEESDESSGQDGAGDAVQGEESSSAEERKETPSGEVDCGGDGAHNLKEEEPSTKMDAKSAEEEEAMETDTSHAPGSATCMDSTGPGKPGHAEQGQPKSQPLEQASCDLGLAQSVAPVTGDGSMADSSAIRDLLQQAKAKPVMTAVPQGKLPSPPGQSSGVAADQWSSSEAPSAKGKAGTSTSREPEVEKQPRVLTSITDLNAHFDRFKEAHELAERKKEILGISNCIESYKCPSLTDEQASALGLDKKTFQCLGCDDTFLFKASLDAHMERRTVFITVVCTWCEGRKDLVFFNKCAFHAHFLGHKLSKSAVGKVMQRSVITPINALSSFKIYTRLSAAEKLAEEEDISNNSTTGRNVTNAMKPVSAPQNVTPRTTSSQAPNRLMGETGKPSVRQTPSTTAVAKSAPVSTSLAPPKIFTMWPPGCAPKGSPSNGDTPVQSDPHAASSGQVALPPTSTMSKEKPVCFVSGFICLGCNERFDKRDKLKNHLQRIVSSPIFQCHVCKMILANGCMVAMHSLIHAGTSKFNLPCPECGSIFSNLKSLIIHENSECLHWSRKPLFKCDFCHKYATSFQGLAKHFESNHVEQFFKCPLCQLAFRGKDSASEHTLQVHRNRSVVFDMLYKCPFCKSVYSEQKLLENHFQSHYRGGDIKIEKFVLTCFKCFKPFDNSNAVRNHVKNVHDPQCRMFTCDLCLWTMAGVDVVIQHRIECSNRNKLGASFGKILQPGLAKSQQKGPITQPKKMFVCGECGQKFPHFSMEALRKHMTEKHSEKIDVKPQGKTTLASSTRPGVSSPAPEVKKKEEPKVERYANLTCGKCQFKSLDRVLFEKHIAVHKSSDTLSQCHQCGLCFTVEGSLKRHLFIKHKIKDVERFHELCKEIVVKGEEEMKKKKQEEKEKEKVREAEKATAERGDRKGSVEAGSAQEGTAGHQEKEEEEEPEEFKCQVCGVEFENNKLLTIHKRSHGLAYLQHQLTRSPEKLARAQAAKTPPEKPVTPRDVKDTAGAPRKSPKSSHIPSDTESSETSEGSQVTV